MLFPCDHKFGADLRGEGTKYDPCAARADESGDGDGASDAFLHHENGVPDEIVR